MNHIHTPAPRQSGFSLVELMVGMVIGLMAVVIMFQVFAVSEGQRRTTTGAGDAQQNGASSLFVMERDARMAGYGINYTAMFGCSGKGYYRKTSTNFSFNLVPTQILNGAAKDPDELTFMYGNPGTFALPSVLSNPTNLTPGYFTLSDPRTQFLPGDVVLAAEVGATKDCWVTQVTSLPDVDGQRNRVLVNAANFDDNGTTRIAQYVPPFSLPVTYAKWNRSAAGGGAGGRLYNLGPAPVVTTYKIVNNTLWAMDAFRPGEDTPIADGIVQMQAQYGYSWDCPALASSDARFVPCKIDSAAITTGIVNPAASINQWADTMAPAPTPAMWRKIVAVRVVLVARSATPDKKDTSGNCTATTIQPVWQATGATLWVDQDPEWRCYRYKTFELVLPLRNLLWYADPFGTPVPSAEDE